MDSEYLEKYQSGAPAGGPKPNDHLILVIGVGGGGSNAVNHMYSQHVDDIQFVVANTDMQALEMSPVPTKLLLGPETTEGLGAGGKPEVARAAAEESFDDICKLLTPKPNMVFVTAGMGGGTGTGASPVVARTAKEQGILTVGIVTIPFFFEGMPKIRMALRGAEELGKYVDALLVINNDRLAEIYPDLEFSLAFAKADDILTVAARSISEIITTPIMINLDMKDVDTTLRDGMTALISVGYGEGEHRMTKAIQNALHSPLMRDFDVYTSKRLLFAFYFSRTIDPPYTAAESNEITQFIRDMNMEVNVIWGYGYDDTLGNQVKFTLLASGFDITVNGKTVVSGKDETEMIIKGADKPVLTEADMDMNDKVMENYGSEKVDDLRRKKETEKYIIFENEELDSDEAIEKMERVPAYLRGKRTTAAAHKGMQQDQAQAKKANVISFSRDDR
ncbi:MAG: cell division protein FtsZ [Muribaculaceae bacterium]|nr:cell division protein FtsZ [Muribaculaceae bacterium]